jgi:RecJ-like exonuclease
MECPDCKGTGKSDPHCICFRCDGSGELCDVCGESCEEIGQNVCDSCTRERNEEGARAS